MQQTIREHRDQPLPRRGEALGRLANKAHAHPHPLRAEVLAHPQAHPQHHAAGRERVIGDPVDQGAQFRSQRRHVELFTDILQPVVQTRIGRGVLRPHHRHHLARTQRHADPSPASTPCRRAPNRSSFRSSATGTSTSTTRVDESDELVARAEWSIANQTRGRSAEQFRTARRFGPASNRRRPQVSKR